MRPTKTGKPPQGDVKDAAAAEEHRQTEALPGKAEVLSRRVFEAANDAFFLHDLDGRIHEVNERACTLLGRSSEELLATPIAALHPEAERRRAGQAVEETRRTGKARFESTFLRADGSTVDVEISARLVDPEEGLVLGLVRDISARKIAEAELEVRNRTLEELVRVEGLVDSLPVGAVLLDRGGRIILANPAARAILLGAGKAAVGDVLTDLGGQPVLSHLSDDLSSVQTEIVLAGSAQRTLAVDARRVGAGGDDRGWILTLRDVTRQKNLLEAERTRRQELDSLYALSRQLLGDHPLTELLTTVCRHLVESAKLDFCKVILSPDDRPFCAAAQGTKLTTSSNFSCVPEPDVLQPIYRSALKSKGPTLLTREDLDPSSEEGLALHLDRVSAVCLLPMRDGQEVVGLFVLGESRRGIAPTFSDERLRLVHAVADQSASAVRRVQLHSSLAQRTSELESANVELIERIKERKAAESQREELQTQLFQSQKLEAVGRLAAGVAHDFNNLLSVILASSEFARELLSEGHPALDDLEAAEDAARRAATLTHQLLAFSRKKILRPEELDLNEVVRGIEKMARRIIGEDIHFATDLAEGVGTIVADPGHIEQILVNLIVNARDAMLGGGELSIATAAAESPLDESSGDRPKPGVVLTVSDNGKGMPEDVVIKIFEPFFTTKGTGGTGLGLATVHGLVGQAGGAIDVASIEGEGTTFRIWLPCSSAATTTKAALVPSKPPPPTEGATILLCEDDPAVRRTAKRILSRGGYNVLEAVDGNHALKLAHDDSLSIDLLLTDVVMPGMDGRELSEKLLALREVRVVFMSGYNDDIISTKGVLQPGVNLLQKPFTSSRLLEAVGEALTEDLPE